MLKLEIVTPEKRLFDDEVDSVTLPTASGEAGILPNHAPMISALSPGVLSYSTRGSVDRVAVTGGFVEVNGNKVAVLADAAQTSDEVDAASARAEREAAEKELASAGPVPVEVTEGLRERVDAAAAKLQLTAAK